MNFLLSPDLIEFRDSLRKFFAERYPTAVMRAHLVREGESDPAWSDDDTRIWAGLGELGVFAASVAEAQGGLGLGLLSLQLILEEAGRCLFSPPLLETLGLSLPALTQLTTPDAQAPLIASIIAGEARCSFAFQALFDEARPKSGISGTASFVPSAHNVSKLLLPVTEADGSTALYLLDLSKAQKGKVSFELTPTLDLSRRYSMLSFKKAEAVKVSAAKISAAAWDELRNVIRIALVAEMVGAADRVMEMTIDFVKTRKQFGRPIGSFQAIQHKLATAVVDLEQVRALSRFAAWAYDNDRKQFALSAGAAKALANVVIPRICEDALQAHGGIGFTAEYDLHLYLRRAKVNALLGCGAGESFDLVADQVLQAAAATK